MAARNHDPGPTLIVPHVERVERAGRSEAGRGARAGAGVTETEADVGFDVAVEMARTPR